MPNLLEIQPEPHISNLLRSRIDAGDFPSAVYVVAENGKVVFADGLGDAVREPEVHPASLDTVYDLASLTKPLVTGLLCARRVESGELTLDSELQAAQSKLNELNNQLDALMSEMKAP